MTSHNNYNKKSDITINKTNNREIAEIILKRIISTKNKKMCGNLLSISMGCSHYDCGNYFTKYIDDYFIEYLNTKALMQAYMSMCSETEFKDFINCIKGNVDNLQYTRNDDYEVC